MTDDALIVFTPSGKRGRFPLGTPLLTAARKLGVDIDSVCGGRALCGRCQITVSEGEFAKHGITSRANHLSPAGAGEARYDDRRGLAADRRLSCQAQITGNAVIDVPADSQMHRQIVRKRAEARQIELDPTIRLHFVEVAEPDLHNPTGDLQRLIAALQDQWGLGDLTADPGLLSHVQPALRAGQWRGTAAIRDEKEILWLWPGLKERIFGLAVDVGSTTIAAHLCDLISGDVAASEGVMNPQIRFGEDLMSRVSYAMMNDGGAVELTNSVRDGIDQLIGAVAAEAGIERADILEAVFVGNPVMHHLLLGIDPVELGGAPFALATDHAVGGHAADLALTINPCGRFHVLPCIAGHVGADTAGMVLSESPHLADDVRLLVDVGTNAEIVLGNRQKLLAASSPTGPAFEGAQIFCGQRAAPGAIERVRIDPATLEPRYKVIGSDLWSDDPGFAADTAKIGVTGLCGSGIIEALAEMYLAGLIKPDGTIDGGLSPRTSRLVQHDRTWSYFLKTGEPEICVTQPDVRAIQLAKGALYAGARLLMDRYGVDTVDRITLTGAFGSHIDGKHAMVLGLIPDCPLDKVAAAGNAAGTGARIALLNRTARAEINTIVRRIEKVETAVEADLQAHFVGAMQIPHASDPFPNLAAAVELPARAGPEASENGQRRRRRRRST